MELEDLVGEEIPVKGLGNFTEIPFTIYKTFREKMEALLDGETLLIKSFEQKTGADVLIRLNKQKFTVIQISYDIVEVAPGERYWVTFNVGINDLSLFTVYRFEEGVFNHGNKFKINDIVKYQSVDERRDTAIVEQVFVSDEDPNQYAYKLTRDDGLYQEEDLVKHVYL